MASRKPRGGDAADTGDVAGGETGEFSYEDDNSGLDPAPPTSAGTPATPAIESEGARIDALPVVAEKRAVPIQPDPLPALDRPIAEPSARAEPVLRHFGTPAVPPQVEAEIEALRTRLGELRTHLVGFEHKVGGELGEIIAFLKEKLHVGQ